MDARTIRIKGKNGTVYLYEDKSYWDKSKGYSTHKRKCVGKIGADGEPVYNRYYKDRETIRSYERQGKPSLPSVSCTELSGEKMIMEKVAKETRIKPVLVHALGEEDASRVLALAYYLVCRGKALSRSGDWLEDRGMGGLGLSSQRVSELLGRIGDDRANMFFKEWLARQARGGNLLFDITSISTYGKDNPYSEWGYNRDRENLEQVNLSLLTNSGSTLPLWYQLLPGSMADVAVMDNVLETLGHLGIRNFTFVGDRGFYSASNLKALVAKGHKFLIPVPSSVGHAQHLISLHRHSLVHPDNIIRDGNTPVYGKTVRERDPELGHVWYHIFFDPMRKDQVVYNMMEKLARCKDELENDQRVETHSDLYDRFFIVKKTSKKVSVKYNDAALKRFKENDSCYWILMTNTIKDKVTALSDYRSRGRDELHFDDIKNLADLRRLRNHSAATVKGKIFVHFIALILLAQLRRDVDAIPEKDRKYLSATDMLAKVETYTKVSFTGHRGAVWSRPTKIQRMVFDLLNIKYQGAPMETENLEATAPGQDDSERT